MLATPGDAAVASSAYAQIADAVALVSIELCSPSPDHLGYITGRERNIGKNKSENIDLSPHDM